MGLTAKYLLLATGPSLFSCFSVSCLQFVGTNFSLLRPWSSASPPPSRVARASCFIISCSLRENPLRLRLVMGAGGWVRAWRGEGVMGGREIRPPASLGCELNDT